MRSNLHIMCASTSSPFIIVGMQHDLEEQDTLALANQSELVHSYSQPPSFSLPDTTPV